MKILVLAYPRSGTKYVAKNLHARGLNVGHEKVYEAGAVSWKHVNEPADFIFHQVRDPLSAITSASTMMRRNRKYITSLTGIEESDPMLFAAKAYVAWHDLIETRNPILRYRVEDLNWERTAFTDHPRKDGSKYSRAVSWDELYALDEEMASKVAALSDLYGYS